MQQKPPFEPLHPLDRADPPLAYGLSRVGLLWQKPDWLFLYWERGDQDLQEDPSVRVVIRLLFDSTEDIFDAQGRSALCVQDRTVSSAKGSCYVQVPFVGPRVQALLGVLSPQDVFYPVASSCFIQMPFGTIQDDAHSEACQQGVGSLAHPSQVDKVAGGSFFVHGSDAWIDWTKRQRGDT